MTDTDDTALNLTGAWNGLFSYPSAIAPTPFTATLTDTGGWLTGTTEELAIAGDAQGKTITATLQGRRTGRSITFLKTYDGMPSGYDMVHYAGDLNHDGTEIEGSWTVPGNWSGKFLMIRASGAGMGLVREVEERVR